MTHFRKRFNADLINDLNERIVQKQQKTSSQKRSKNDPPDNDGGTSSSGSSSSSTQPKNGQSSLNQGKLLVDATCAPSDITYPTDIGLLNEARKKLEGIIDTLHSPLIGKQRKPRTYRRNARKQYLSLAKQRKPGLAKIHKGIKQQLGYAYRNLKHVEKLAFTTGLHTLSNKQYRDLLVSHSGVISPAGDYV